jgi:hypothetical protein
MVGYFKVREGAGKRKRNVGVAVAYAVVGGVIVVFIGLIGFWTYRPGSGGRGPRRRRSSFHPTRIKTMFTI